MALLHKIKNLVEASPQLITGGQPTAVQLRSLHEHGIQHVINLGLTDTEYSINDEQAIIESQGIGYTHIPVEFSSPTNKDLELFFTVMGQQFNNKVFVHCAANKRATCFVVLWAEARLGWSRSEADRLINSVWQPDEIWSSFLALMRSTDFLTCGKMTMK